MKKIMMLSMFLIGLGMSAKLYAQQDLEVKNNSSCTVIVTAYGYDGTCPGTTSSGFTLGPGGSATIPNPIGTCTAMIYQAQVNVLGGMTANVGTGCTAPGTPITVINCTSGTTFLSYTPPSYVTPSGSGSAGVNAKLTIN